jgi:hypothetical protein
MVLDGIKTSEPNDSLKIGRLRIVVSCRNAYTKNTSGSTPWWQGRFFISLKTISKWSPYYMNQIQIPIKTSLISSIASSYHCVFHDIHSTEILVHGMAIVKSLLFLVWKPLRAAPWTQADTPSAVARGNLPWAPRLPTSSCGMTLFRWPGGREVHPGRIDAKMII